VSLTISSRVAFSLSSYLDLNDLHSLSLTCRSIHSSLTQYAKRLKSNSLKCAFDSQPLLSELIALQLSSSAIDSDSQIALTGADRTEASLTTPQFLQSLYSSRGPGCSSSKISACARDLVAECRKCGTPVCRNCTAKAPSDRYLKERHRRLCQKCLKAPLAAHLEPLNQVEDDILHDTPPMSSASSTRSARSTSEASSQSLPDPAETTRTSATTFTSAAFLREPCTCHSRGVYLCQWCGHNLRASDTTYKRVWTWRSRYSTHIGGGLGTGLGVGDQGQKCGRGEQCLETGAGSISWVEIDCSEGHGSEHSHEHDSVSISRAGTPTLEGSSAGPANNRPGYLQQEVEGIGGVVKKKVRKKIKVGATVYEFEDERKDPRKYLEREASGKERSWCGWCGRVCPGEEDRDGSP
jgi:hypothetical protein